MIADSAQRIFKEARNLLLIACSAHSCDRPYYLNDTDAWYSGPSTANKDETPFKAVEGLVVPKNVRLKHVLLRDVLKWLVLPAAAQPRHTI